MDLDGDGQLDVISGSFPGELYLFRGLGRGRFAPREVIKGKDGKAINVGGASTVFAADWDGDGRLDLLVGTLDGKVFLIPNEGTPTHYQFGKPRPIEADGKPIELAAGDSHPVLADWDRDGRPDLLVGTGAGSVLWYRNIGSRTAPKLAAPQTLVPESPSWKRLGTPLAEGQWGIRAKICVTDWNGDGWPDLLLGDYSYVTGATPKLTDADLVEQDKVARQWSRVVSQYLEATADLQEATEVPAKERAGQEQAREQKLRSCTQRLAELQKELAEVQQELNKYEPSRQSHGHVWLFQRQPLQAAAKP